MSYDISLYANLGGPHSVKVGNLNENYTYNLSEFFTWFLGRRLGDFNGVEASELKSAIMDGFERLCGKHGEESPTLEFLKGFEPNNGWGSVLGAMAFLSRILVACIEAPEAIVGVG